MGVLGQLGELCCIGVVGCHPRCREAEAAYKFRDHGFSSSSYCWIPIRLSTVLTNAWLVVASIPQKGMPFLSEFIRNISFRLVVTYRMSCSSGLLYSVSQQIGLCRWSA